MKVRGGGDIEEWRSALKQAPKILEELSEQMAEEVIDLVAAGFAKQEDPYGEGWEKKKVGDGRSILVGKTTRLRRGWHKAKRGKNTWAVVPSVVYAAAHQDPRPRAAWGGKKLPRRAMIPDSRGLPPKWRKSIHSAAMEALKMSFKSSGGGKLSLVGYKLVGLKRRFNAAAIIKRAIREATG